MGQRVKLRLGPAEQRRSQGSGQRQVIGIQRDEGQKRGQVAHRQFTAQFQPVRPGDGQPLRFAGADDFMEQIAPALHQDQHVALGQPLVAALGQRDARARVD